MSGVRTSKYHAHGHAHRGSSLVGLGWSPTPYDALGSSVPRPPPCSSLVGPGSATNGVGSEGLGISNLFVRFFGPRGSHFSF